MVLEAGVTGSLGTLVEAIARSFPCPCCNQPYLDFPTGRKLTIFSPSLINATRRGRGTLSICTYQRSTNSVKASISFSRLLATGLMAGSSGASATQAGRALTGGGDLGS